MKDENIEAVVGLLTTKLPIVTVRECAPFIGPLISALDARVKFELIFFGSLHARIDYGIFKGFANLSSQTIDRLVACGIVIDSEWSERFIELLLKDLESCVTIPGYRHWIATGILRGMTILDSLNQKVGFEEVTVAEVLARIFATKDLPKLTDISSGDQGNLIASFLKPPHRRLVSIAIAKGLSKMKPEDKCKCGEGTLQFADNLSYKFFGRVTTFDRLDMIANATTEEFLPI